MVRINFVRGGRGHINGIESLLSFTKRRLAKLNSVKVKKSKKKHKKNDD